MIACASHGIGSRFYIALTKVRLSDSTQEDRVFQGVKKLNVFDSHIFHLGGRGDMDLFCEAIHKRSL